MGHMGHGSRAQWVTWVMGHSEWPIPCSAIHINRLTKMTNGELTSNNEQSENNDSWTNKQSHIYFVRYFLNEKTTNWVDCRNRLITAAHRKPPASYRPIRLTDDAKCRVWAQTYYIVYFYDTFPGGEVMPCSHYVRRRASTYATLRASTCVDVRWRTSLQLSAPVKCMLIILIYSDWRNSGWQPPSRCIRFMFLTLFSCWHGISSK